MSHYIIHPLTSVEILLVPNRALRPNAFGVDDQVRCPFCPGHEGDTPPAVEVLPLGEQWQVRVFPNLYPITDSTIKGMHEVIVDTPQHDQRPHALDHAELETLLKVYADRFAHAREKGCAYSLLFKNDGAAAGQSLEHPHTQFIALHTMPRTISRRETKPGCPICSDLADARFHVSETGRVRWLAPSASRLPYEVMIVPKDHRVDPVAFLREELSAIASLLRDALGAIHALFGDVGFNLIIESCASAPGHVAIALVPRLTTLGGFELATNMLINVVDPQHAATRYRDLMEKGR